MVNENKIKKMQTSHRIKNLLLDEVNEKSDDGSQNVLFNGLSISPVSEEVDVQSLKLES